MQSRGTNLTVRLVPLMQSDAGRQADLLQGGPSEGGPGPHPGRHRDRLICAPPWA